MITPRPIETTPLISHRNLSKEKSRDRLVYSKFPMKIKVEPKISVVHIKRPIINKPNQMAVKKATYRPLTSSRSVTPNTRNTASNDIQKYLSTPFH